MGVFCKAFFWAACALVAVGAQKGQGADGNPHGWDRTRRCDHSDYDPPCGICEGVGGIPTGDDNSDITLVPCVGLANASAIDPLTLKRPVWARTWSTHSWEVLIGPKTDPFCFTTIPSNTSHGKLCYRPQTGVQNYDFTKTRALREDINVYSAVGNVTTTFIHQGQNLWIVNKFPWYAAGAHQCVCTHAREGGDPKDPGIWPVATNWTNNLGFVARENITVEYEQGTKTLDHWAFGPHHVWSYPETGRILRMWQPFNGLQIFPEGTSSAGVDPSLFTDMPPKLCKKGGAAFRVKCADNGYPNDVNTTDSPDIGLELMEVLNGTTPDNNQNASSVSEYIASIEAATAHPSVEAALSAVQAAISNDTTPANDLRRAYTMVPRHNYRGQTFQDMSEVLNQWLQDSPGVTTRACADWNFTKIQDLQKVLYALRDVSLDGIYQEANDNRALTADLDAMQEDWAVLNRLAETAADPVLAAEVRRDGHCHEAVMWYTHHITQDVKRAVSHSGLRLEIPLLSTYYHADDDDVLDAAKADHNLARVLGAYEEHVTCLSCHSDAP